MRESLISFALLTVIVVIVVALKYYIKENIIFIHKKMDEIILNTTVSSDLEDEEVLEVYYQYAVFYYSVHLLLGIVFNSFTLLVLRHENCGFDGSTNMICRALLVGDTISMTCFTIDSICRYTDVPSKEITCVYLFLVGISLFILSQLFMFLLTLDRLLKVWKPLLYTVYVNATRVKFTIIFTTVLIFIFFVALIASWRENDTVIDFCMPQDRIAPNRLLWTMITFMPAMLAIALTMFAHIGTLVIAVRIIAASERRLQPIIGTEATASTQQSNHVTGQVDFEARPGPAKRVHRTLSRLKCVRTVLILVAAAYTANIPQVTVICLAQTSPDSVPLWMYILADTASSCNTWWDGFIFMLTNRQFRETARGEIERIKNCCRRN